MPKADVTYNTIGFVGTVGTGATFTLYLDDEKTGAKTYHVYFKQLGGTGKLTLTTGVSGKANLELNVGTYVAIIYVDQEGNVTSQGATPTSTIATGNYQPATSSAVYDATKDTSGKIYSFDVRNKDLNECIIQENKTCVSFWSNYQSGSAIPNAPTTDNYFVTTYQLVNTQNTEWIRLTQIATQNRGSNTDIGYSYIRQGFSNTGYSNITWGGWARQTLPSAPSSNGTYNLQCVVTDGIPAFSWEGQIYYKDFTDIDCSYSTGDIGSRGNQVLFDPTLSGYTIIGFRIQYIQYSDRGMIMGFFGNMGTNLYINTYRTMSGTVQNKCTIRVFYTNTKVTSLN
jgi:hypothetical protein